MNITTTVGKTLFSSPEKSAFVLSCVPVLPHQNLIKTLNFLPAKTCVIERSYGKEKKEAWRVKLNK